MNIELEDTALMKFLEAKAIDYFAKVRELRKEVAGWLSYVPATFPHYTRHTIEHSEEIVLQASKLIFADDNISKPVVPISPAEAYILIAAAFLHDAGMVTPDREKAEILSSEAWKNWTSGDGGGAKRWLDIQNFRQGKEPTDDAVRNFLADVQTRFLVAEFVRRVHHRRAANVIEQHQSLLGRFAFDNQMLRDTIADVCVAHGLRQHELEDAEHYPDRRDINGQTVNVRFVAIMLRLGDLLDMSHDRACPLLLNAASPVPADSLAHWKQYDMIKHRLTSPDRIEIRAECEKQEEHRVLQDWCQWIVEEVKNAKVLMPRAARHRDWQLPIVGFEGEEETIVIRPAKGASYFPSKWSFELDNEAVFQRLIYDVYDSPESFIRELIQNGLDAMRCKMYADLMLDGVKPPEYPTQVEEARRRRYVLHVSLGTKEVKNDLSGEVETKQVLKVEDCGIGMDTDIIKRYFLQVGRSYYVTEEFRRNYGFIPTSRFGVGFLSVFAVSDEVTVETYKVTLPGQDGAIRLTLTGPRNYLLTERGERRSTGTRIEVQLREEMIQGRLTELIESWCRRVEFPVAVDDLGVEKTVVAESPEQFVYEMPNVTEEDAKFVVRQFPINRPGIEGEIYIFAGINSKRESWDAWEWASNNYSTAHPHAVRPTLPESVTCLHGIAIGEGEELPRRYYAPYSVRLDYRRNTHKIALSRDMARHRHGSNREPDPELTSRLEEILSEHLMNTSLAKSDDSWKYKQLLVDSFPLFEFWRALPQTIRIFQGNNSQLFSLDHVQAMPIITMVRHPDWWGHSRMAKSERNKVMTPAWDSADPSISEGDWRAISIEHKIALLKDRVPKNLRWLRSGHLAIDWHLGIANVVIINRERYYLVEIPGSSILGFVDGSVTNEIYLLNVNHPLISWSLLVREACDLGKCNLDKEQFEKLLLVIRGGLSILSAKRLNNYIEGWRSLPDLPPELYPPEIELTDNMLLLMPLPTRGKPKGAKRKERKREQTTKRRRSK
ncbi:MAG TPA: hypothetical protein VF525_11035 [Pyrinomonadaceae bacterium]